MRAGNPLVPLSAALYGALFIHLPDIEYESTDWASLEKLSKADKAKLKPVDYPKIMRKRRPREEEIEVDMFQQTWGSTALGFGGMGGAAMTSAYTIVIEYRPVIAVYFDGRFAYAIDHRKVTPQQYTDFKNDVAKRFVQDCLRAKDKYGAQLEVELTDDN